MIITYSGKSAPSAFRLAEQSDNIELNRGSEGDINWGRAWANTRLNPDISNVTNKRVMRGLFAERNVPMPRLVTFAEMVDSEYGKVFVGRPDHHTKGRGLWIIRTWDDHNRALNGTRRKAAATHFMEFVDAPREYRVHIFQGKSVRLSEKAYLDPDDKKLGYTTAKPQHEVEHVREAAKQAVAAVGLDFGAVDVLANDEECWVLEVNAAPGLGGSMPRLYAELFTAYMQGEEDNDEG